MSLQTNPSPITTHVLDTAHGHPAAGVAIVLEELTESGWLVVGGGTTDSDGRLRTLLQPGTLKTGTYRLIFDTGTYFTAQQVVGYFYPQAVVVFAVRDPGQHYHVPLLLSPFGYSTYRGS